MRARWLGRALATAPTCAERRWTIFTGRMGVRRTAAPAERYTLYFFDLRGLPANGGPDCLSLAGERDGDKRGSVHDKCDGADAGDAVWTRDGGEPADSAEPGLGGRGPGEYERGGAAGGDNSGAAQCEEG